MYLYANSSTVAKPASAEIISQSKRRLQTAVKNSVTNSTKNQVCLTFILLFVLEKDISRLNMRAHNKYFWIALKYGIFSKNIKSCPGAHTDIDYAIKKTAISTSVIQFESRGLQIISYATRKKIFSKFQ